MLMLNMVWIVCVYQARSGLSQNVDCNSGPCQNGALCEDTDSGFQCFCVDGYAGELCEINFDDCISTPCRNNATCIDDVAGYTCLCAEGFTGQDCQLNIDECQSSPCLRNGTCIDLVDGFVCECVPPFRGDNCSSLPCDVVPCENEAVCRDDLAFNESLSGFVCDCITGFSGPRCEINLEDCDLENFTSCSGNGLCVDGINDYSCLCEPGWVGDYCEFPIDDCIGSSCKNNATCTDLHLGYQCTCESGYEGSLCERERDECSKWQPCKNGAVCVDLFDEYKCECAEGWFGVNCTKEVNECQTNECQNGAQCLDVIGGFQCRCPPFYTGLLCETLYNPCAPEFNPCQNGANCIVPPDGKYRCYCAAGVHCEVNVNECLSSPCENNATCEDITAGYICHCTLGWEGQNCQDNVDDCALEPCQNGADCMDLHNGFECNCTREYQGPVCDEAVDFCLKDPCYHDSTCLSFVGGYTCLCSAPYTGDQCLELIDSCKSAPCENNGTCMNTVSGFICSCPLPYTGKTCNDRVDFCESQPCFVGTCVSLANDFVCVCPEYITGKQCTDLVDYCGDFPCENDGNCINGEFDFRCSCAYGFTGRTCTEMIDFCVDEPCQNDANCSNIPGGFKCLCLDEFTGDLCQTIIPTVITSSPSYTSSSFSYISSMEPTVSSLMHSTVSVFSSSDSVFSVFTATSVSGHIISTSLSLDIKPSTVRQYSSGTASILRSLETSTVSSFPDSSASSRSSMIVSVIQYTVTRESTSNIHTLESSTFDIYPSFSGTVRSSEIESTSIIMVTSIIKSVYSPTQKQTDDVSSSRISSLSIASFSTDAFIMFSQTTIVSADISELSSNRTSIIMSMTDSRSSIRDSKITSVSPTFSNWLSTMSYLSTYSVLINDSGTVSIRSTRSSVSKSDITASSKSFYPESTFSSGSILLVSSTSVTGKSGGGFSTLVTHSESNLIVPTTVSSYTLLASSNSKYRSFSMLTDSPISSTNSSTHALNVYTSVPSSTISYTYYPTSVSAYSGKISEESSLILKDTVTPTSTFKTSLTAATSVATSFTESSDIYSLKSTEKSSFKTEKSTIPFTYTSIIEYTSSFDGRTSSTYSGIELSDSLSYISISITEKETNTNVFKTSATSDTESKRSTNMLSVSMFSTSDFRNSSLVHSTKLNITVFTSFTHTEIPPSMMSKTVSDLGKSSATKDSLMLSTISTGIATASESFSSKSKSSEYISKSSAVSALPSMTMFTNSSSYYPPFSTDLSISMTFTKPGKTNSLLVSEFTPSSTVEFTKIMSLITETSVQLSTSPSYIFTIETSSNIDSTKSSDISRTLSHSQDIFSSTTNPSPVPFTSSGAFSQIDPSLYTSSVLLDASTINIDMTPATKSFTPATSYSIDTSTLQSSFTTDTKTSSLSQISPTSSFRNFSSDTLISSLTMFDSTMFQTSTSVVLFDSIVTSTVTPSEEVRLTYRISSSEAVQITNTVTSIKEFRPTSTQTSNERVNSTKPFISSEGSQPTDTIYSSETFQSTLNVTSTKTIQPTDSVTSIKTVHPTNTVTSIKTVQPTITITTTNTVPTSTAISSTSPTSPATSSTAPTSLVTSSTSPTSPATSSTSSTSPATSSTSPTSPATSSTSPTSPATSSTSPTSPATSSTSSTSPATSSTSPTSPATSSTSSTSPATSSTSPTSPATSSTVPTSTTTTPVSTTTSVPPATCDNLVCYNGGVCREDVSGTFCDCGDRYLGHQCETESTACEGYVCENGGFCVVTLTVFDVQVPKCNCRLPFVGLRCESEKLIYYPTFIGSSYLEFSSPGLSPDQSNEIYISVKTTQRDATILYSANQDVDYKQAAFIAIHLTNGKLGYSFSCDGVMTSTVESDMVVNTGNVYEIVIRQIWSAGPGDWCSAAMVINSRAFVSGPLLAVKQSQALGKLYIGGTPRFTQGTVVNTHIMDGYIGCVHNFQVNQKEIDLITMAIEGLNIDNCNIPVCQYNPCKNGATCHSSGEEWYCSCLPGYGGSLCERKLCGVNPCQHGGTCIILEEERDQLCLCAYGRGGPFCETALSVTLPHFIGNQYGYSSYVAYDHPHYLEDDFEIEFSMILDNGSSDSSLIVFLGNTGSYDGRRDYMAVGVERGYILFRFDLGSGYAQIYSAEELDMSLHQHSIRLGRDRHAGWVQVDNQRNVTGRSPGVLTALNTNSKLYVGNVEFSEIGILPNGAEFEDGFRGCIFNLKIKSHITDFVPPGSPPGHVTNGRNIGQCSSMSCDQNPCQNGAECRDLGASIYCICLEGWKGTFCTDVITVCDLAHACTSGSSCVPIIPEGYACLCPLGKKGVYCEQDLNISDPLFPGESSYMSFEPVYIKRKIDIQIQMKTNSSAGLLFYVAERLHSHAGDFLSLTLHNGKVEMRIDMGTGVNILRNEAELNTDRWYTIEAGRNITHSYISVDGDSITAQLTGMMTFLDTTTDFYIGGLSNLGDASPDAFENEPVAFQGCIRELIVNNILFHLDANGATDGRSIDDCDSTSCGYNVCKNGGNCSVQDTGAFSCTCNESFVGRTCEIPAACSSHECLNGKCRANGEDDYVCDCFIGWTGIFCDEDVVFEASVELSTESFIYLIDENFPKSNKSNTDISFTFKTTRLTGLILWNGQSYSDDEDYLGVGIQDGRVKLVWNLGWYSRGEIFTSLKFNDGTWHSLNIKREKQILTLDIDGVTYDSRVSGDFFNLDTFGQYSIGSFKDGHVRDMTLGYFTEPFHGCLKDVRVNKDVYVNFNTADEGMNILPCSSD